MLRLSEWNSRVLRAIVTHGPLTGPELNAVSELADDQPKLGCGAALKSLMQLQLVDTRFSERDARTRIYSATPKAARLLTQIEAAAAGALALPRTQDEDAGTYTGAELRSGCARAGAMRAFELPSLENGQRVERRRPALLGTDRNIKAVA